MKVFLVVGMHRSATSLVARGLHNSGVHMGDNLIGAMPSNPHGHFEDRRAVLINDRILTDAGGKWNHPPSHERIMQSDTSLLEEYVEARSTEDMWGVKDPRLCLTWPLWTELLDDVDLHLVKVWRHPKQIADSLHRRNKIPIPQGVNLAREYQKRMP